MERDVVCDMKVKISMSTPIIIYNKQTYYFCSEICKIQFKEEPEKYLKNDVDEKHRHTD